MIDEFFVRCAYEVILNRLPESADVVAHYRMFPSRRDVTLALLRSEEFRKLMPSPLTSSDSAATSNSDELNLFESFGIKNLIGTPGFITDFLGVRTRVSYFSGLDRMSGMVDSVPYPNGNWHGDYVEWFATMTAVAAAQSSFTAFEIGAGWAPWLVTSATAARSRGISDIQLTAVEASSDHIAMINQHFLDNELDPGSHSIIHGAASDIDGIQKFPRLPDPTSDWGAAIHSEQGSTDYRGFHFETFDEVKTYSLRTLIQKSRVIDLLHIDIQGAESSFVIGGIEDIRKSVKHIVIGTHSRQIEGEIADALANAGFQLKKELPCQAKQEGNRITYPVDGCQFWVNLMI